jgi:murein DD-endopeptidase MepM/ murein hydrolase activator NlpD
MMKLLILIPSVLVGLGLTATASNAQSACPKPALSRIIRHKVVAGETLDNLAAKYKLIPATIMGLNPSAQDGTVTPGEELQIPPFNGIQVEIPAGQTWKDIATKYRVRPDLLFEVNGCQKSPTVVFLPGVNWSPVSGESTKSTLRGYPLARKASVLLAFGWYLPPGQEKPIFHSGLDLAAAAGSEVRSLSSGTVAFAGKQGVYGDLIVINHAKGYQTRYAQLGSIKVKTGQKVNAGTAIATVGKSGTPSSTAPHLHFEVRSNSKVGWVAEDPTSFLQPK